MSQNLIGPDGREYHIESDDAAALQKARALGYRTSDEAPVTGVNPENYGDESGAVGAAARGAIHGSSFGLLRDFTTSEPERELAQAENKEHPIAYGAGELAGTVLSPLNKVGVLVEGPRAATAAARLGQRALGGAAVGTLFGAGNAVSDAALGDPDLTADKVLAHIGLGALLGAAGGGVGTAVEEGVVGVLPSLSRSAPKAQSALEEFADDRWLKAAGGIQSDIKKIPAAEHGAVADAIRAHLSEPGAVLPRNLDDALASLESERGAVGAKVIGEAGITDAGGLAPHLSRDEAVAALERAEGAHGQRMGAVMDAADKLGAKPSYSQVLSRLDSFEAGLNPAERDLAAKPLSDLRRYLDEMGGKPVGSKQNSFAALNELKSTLTKGINYKVEDNVAIGLKKQLAGILRDEIDTQLAPQIGSDLSKEWLAAKGEFGALARAGDALGRKASTGLDAIRALAVDASNAPPSLPRLSALEHARNLLQHGIDRKLGNRWLSASDYLTGIGTGVMSGGPAGALTGLASSVAHKFMRENGAGVIAKLADRMAASPALSTAAKSFAAQLPTTAPKLGAYAPALLNAAAQSPEAALATHMTLAQVDPSYAATAQLAGLTPEQPDEHVASLVRAHRIAETGTAATETDRAVNKHLDRIIKGMGAASTPASLQRQDFGNKRMRRDVDAAHEQRVKEVRELAADPNKLLERIAGNLDGVPPAVAAALSARAASAVSYLAQAAGVPPKPGPLAHDWAPTQAEMHDFAQKLEVVERPLSVLSHAASGMMTEQQVDALKAVYPGLAKDIADKVTMKLAESPSTVPYGARFMLSLLSDVDPDGTLSSEAIAANQSAISAAAARKAAQGAPGSLKHADSLTLAQRTATPSERRDTAEE